MIPESRKPTHPGEILVEEFLRPMGTSQAAFARLLGIPLQRVNEIATGKRGVTADTAWRFAVGLGTSPQFWMNLQVTYDLYEARPKGTTNLRFATKKSKGDYRMLGTIGMRSAAASPGRTVDYKTDIKKAH